MTTILNRAPKGQPTGGEFAAQNRTEASVELNLSDSERLERGVGVMTIELGGGGTHGADFVLEDCIGQVGNGFTSGHYPTWSVGAEAADVGTGPALIIELDGNSAEETMQHIADQIDAGNTSGYYPTWNFQD